MKSAGADGRSFRLRAAPHNGARRFGQCFDTSESMENAGILDVFPVFHTARLGQKIIRRPLSPLCGVALGESSENEGILHVFPVFRTERIRQKIRRSAAGDLFSVSPGYALGNFGNNATLPVMQIVFLIFATKVLGISGAIMGILFMVARFGRPPCGSNANLPRCRDANQH